MKHIYVSPHSDDVALSCGGRILSDRARVGDTMILTMFTSDAGSLQSDCDPGGKLFARSISAERQGEDEAAWAEAGIEAHYADLPEALLRRQFPFALHPRRRDRAIVDRVRDVLLDHARRHPGALLHVPAGFGNHIDHLACRAAAFRLLDDGAVDRIMLYEDLPYGWLRFIRTAAYRALLRQVTLSGAGSRDAFRPLGHGLLDYLVGSHMPFPKGKALFTALALALRIDNLARAPFGGCKRYRGEIHVFAFDEAAMAAKRRLVYHYASQLPMLFGGDPDAMLDQHRLFFAREQTIEISKLPQS